MFAPGGPNAAVGMIAPMGTNDPRYRCNACGNLTRFDVTVSRRVKEFQHFSVGGELEIESTDVLEEIVERVECRWCGASGDAIEVAPVSV